MDGDGTRPVIRTCLALTCGVARYVRSQRFARSAYVVNAFARVFFEHGLTVYLA